MKKLFKLTAISLTIITLMACGDNTSQKVQSESEKSQVNTQEVEDTQDDSVVSDTIANSEEQEKTVEFQSYEIKGYEFQVPSAWVKKEENDKASFYIYDEANPTIVSFYASAYESDNFEEQYKFFDDAMNLLGANKQNYSREQISKYTVGDIMFFVGECSDNEKHQVYAFLPDKTSNSIITVSMTESKDSANSYQHQFLEVLNTISPTETKISQEEVWANAEKDPMADFTLSQKNAIERAQSYLSYSGFSRVGLIRQLSSDGEGYPAEDAEIAVSYLEQNGLVDWNAEAAEKAQSYMNYSNFSRDGLYNQLVSDSEGFTPEQAEYALSQVGY